MKTLGKIAGGIGLLLALEQQNVGHPLLGEEVRERSAGDAPADDDDVEIRSRHAAPWRPSHSSRRFHPSSAALFWYEAR